MSDIDYTGLIAFSKCIQTFPYERGGKTIELQIDIDAFTSNYFRNVRKRMQAKFTELVKEDEATRAALVDKIYQNEQAEFEKAKTPSSSTALVPASQFLIEGEAELQAPTREAVVARLNFSPLIDPEAATSHLELEARTIDENKEITIELLRGDLDENPTEGTGVLVDWKIPDLNVPCSKKALSYFSPKAVQELWEFCADKANTVKKTPDN